MTDRSDPTAAPRGGAIDAPQSALRPLRVAEMVEQVFRIYRADARLLIGVTAVVLGPLYLVTGALGLDLATRLVPVMDTLRAGGPGRTVPTVDLLPIAAIWSLIGLLGAIGDAAATIAIAAVVAQRLLRLERPTAGGTARLLRARARGLVAGYLLSSLAFVAILGVGGVAAPLAIALLDPSMARGQGGPGALLLLVAVVATTFAVVALSVRWAVWSQALVVEDGGGRSALGRSWDLVRGSEVRVLGIAIVFGVIDLAVTQTIDTVAAVVLGDPLAPGSVVSAAGTLAVSTVASVLATPITAIGMTVLYLDLRARRLGLTPRQR